MIFNEKKCINDPSDFEEYCSEAFTNFLSDFDLHNGLIRDVQEDDGVSEEFQFMYTTKGQRLAERMLDRLHKVGLHYWPDDTFDISSHLFRED